MPATNEFAKMMPGFDFLQNMMKNAGAGLPGLPGMTQWVSPTLDPDELDKRIGELRTVQFWLEQNARLLATTVQALEVQRLTLSTLKTMNLPLADIGESLRIKLPDPPAPSPAPEPAAAAPAPAPEPAAGAAPAPAVVDPMAWWGSLTQQFAELAASAMKDVRAEAAAPPAAGAAAAATKGVPKAAHQAAHQAAKKAAKPAAKKALRKPAKKAAGTAARKASAQTAPRSPGG